MRTLYDVCDVCDVCDCLCMMVLYYMATSSPIHRCMVIIYDDECNKNEVNNA